LKLKTSGSSLIILEESMKTVEEKLKNHHMFNMGWDETTLTSVPWRQGCSHPTRNQCMGWLTLPFNMLDLET